MEDEQVASEIVTRRSKRPRAQNRANDERAKPQPQSKAANSARGEISENEEEEEEREESSDDFQELRSRAKRNRAAVGAPASARKPNQRLIEIIKGNGKQIAQVVKHWVERYEKDPMPATVELLTMLFEACGAKYHIKEEFLDNTDVDDVVVALVNLARKGEVEDYQSSKKEFKIFKDNLMSFWDSLVVECQNGPLFDQGLFDKCMDYIIALSCTPPRVYRQVASLMGLQLVTSFINVAKMLGAQRETTQRQLNAEKKKRTDGPRVESLNKRLSMTHERITVIEEMMRKLFTGLFVHRYRDIDPDIRMSCIQSLGVWILLYPSLFLQDLYLKYLGWTLNDKSAGVRKASILALQNLYEVDDNVPSLGLFTERFYKRMLELADDIDISVAVCAIGLVKQLLRHQLVPDEELGSLYDLLIDDPPEIRRAIGALVYDHLIAQKFNSSQSTGGDDDSSEVHLSRMLQILREFSTDQILSTYVIDDVWEYMDAMKDWKCIISMLLDENPSSELSDVDATSMIRLIGSSVKKAVGERIVPATDNRKQYYTKAQREMFENNRRDITIAMMKNYPQLLHKFMADKAKVPFLVEIIVHMNLELYSLKRQEQSFKNVLKLIKEAFFKHGEKDALRSCTKAFNYCATESRGELQDFAQNQLKELENELIIKVRSAMKEIADGDDEYSLLVNLKRLYEFQLSRQIGIDRLYEDFSQILQRFRNMDDEVISFLLLNMYLHVAWSLHAILTSEKVSEATLSSLVSKRTALCEQLEYFLFRPEIEESKPGSQLACRVCTILAEIWCLFRKDNYASTKLESLGFCPSDAIVQKFWRSCEQQLHNSGATDETEDEEVNKEYVEETNRDAVMIAAAKLVATEAVPKDYLGSEIISHFVMHGTSVSEIVKHLIAVLRKKDDDISVIFLDALKRAYQRHMLVVSTSNDESLSSKSFQDCKDLAARLSGLFVGVSRNKHRSEILYIVSAGIEYAFWDAPKQLSFLDGAVLHFVSKLPTTDILDVLKDVEKRAENVNTDEDPSGWRPYYAFVDTLHEKYAKNEGLQDDKEGTTVRRRGRPRKKQNLQGKGICGTRDSVENVLAFIQNDDRLRGLRRVESPVSPEEEAIHHGHMSSSPLAAGEDAPFRWDHVRVKLKKEIVTLGMPSVSPIERVGEYVNPRDWNSLVSEPDVVVIDVRNDYETRIGKFKGAVDPCTVAFRDFPSWVENRFGLTAQKDQVETVCSAGSAEAAEKEKNILPRVAMYCTGGIRCEKASSFLLSKGFEEVYHLEGGILKYLEEVPKTESLWEGECFVFDKRVSVEHGLVQGTFKLCYGCKQPVSDEDMEAPEWEYGVSCPYCYSSKSEEEKERARARQRQFERWGIIGGPDKGRKPVRAVDCNNQSTSTTQISNSI